MYHDHCSCHHVLSDGTACVECELFRRLRSFHGYFQLIYNDILVRLMFAFAFFAHPFILAAMMPALRDCRSFCLRPLLNLGRETKKRA